MATRSGVAATRMLVSEDEIRSSAKPSRRNGPAICAAARTTSHPARSRRPASARTWSASGSSTTAASAVREKATQAGESSSTATAMKR
jgi:hypothetical protein